MFFFLFFSDRCATDVETDFDRYPMKDSAIWYEILPSLDTVSRILMEELDDVVTCKLDLWSEETVWEKRKLHFVYGNSTNKLPSNGGSDEMKQE